MEQNQNSSLFQLNLDAQNSYTLRSAASWAKVLGICGIIVGVLFVVFGLMLQQNLRLDDYESRRSGISANAFGNAGLVGNLIMALIFIISSVFAMNAGNKINRGLKTNDQETLNAGFAGARNYFAFWAIMMILMLILMFLGLVGIMTGPRY